MRPSSTRPPHTEGSGPTSQAPQLPEVLVEASGLTRRQLGYPTLMYYNKPARGGHFAAWEEPQLFTEELRAAFRPLR
jgi:hypothetical protein